MGHVLGIGTHWHSKGVLTAAGGADPEFTGANAIREYNSIFGTTATGVPVENTGGPGTRDGHWRESVFTTELMTGWADPGALPLSRVTIGSLQDIGYSVNYAAADAFTPSARGLSAARQAASTSAALRGLRGMRGLVASTDPTATSVTNVGLTTGSWNVTSERSARMTGSLVDTVYADEFSSYATPDAGQTASSGSSAASSTGTHSSIRHDAQDTDCAPDNVWDSLASDLNFWPALAHA
jgi:hypothetical protein